MTFVFLQGMVEVVAENYHNIWAKKKKSELVSKGVLMCSSRGKNTAERFNYFSCNPLNVIFECDWSHQEEGPTHCWCPMTP